MIFKLFFMNVKKVYYISISNYIYSKNKVASALSFYINSVIKKSYDTRTARFNLLIQKNYLDKFNPLMNPLKLTRFLFFHVHKFLHQLKICTNMLVKNDKSILLSHQGILTVESIYIKNTTLLV